MNWRRGLKRLYVVCTLLWIVTAIAIAANSYRSHRYRHHSSLTTELATDRASLQKVQPVYYDDNGEPLPPEAQSEWVDVPESELKGTPRQKLASIRAANEAKVRAQLIESRRKKLADTERRLKASNMTLDDNTVVAAFTPPQLLGTLALIFLPPLAVAIAFLVLDWIIRGFRHDVPPPSTA